MLLLFLFSSWSSLSLMLWLLLLSLTLCLNIKFDSSCLNCIPANIIIYSLSIVKNVKMHHPSTCYFTCFISFCLLHLRIIISRCNAVPPSNYVLNKWQNYVIKFTTKPLNCAVHARVLSDSCESPKPSFDSSEIALVGQKYTVTIWREFSEGISIGIAFDSGATWQDIIEF